MYIFPWQYDIISQTSSLLGYIWWFDNIDNNKACYKSVLRSTVSFTGEYSSQLDHCNHVKKAKKHTSNFLSLNQRKWQKLSVLSLFQDLTFRWHSLYRPSRHTFCQFNVFFFRTVLVAWTINWPLDESEKTNETSVFLLLCAQRTILSPFTCDIIIMYTVLEKVFSVVIKWSTKRVCSK